MYKIIIISLLAIFVTACQNISSDLTTVQRPKIPFQNKPTPYSLTNYFSSPNNLLIYPLSPTVTYGQVALLGLNLNNSGNKITVRPVK